MNSLEKLKALAQRNAVFPFTLPLVLRFDPTRHPKFASSEVLFTPEEHPLPEHPRFEHIAEVRFWMNLPNTAECVSFHKKNEHNHSERYRLDALLPETLDRLATRFHDGAEEAAQ